jgi:hypothetical protein
VQRAGHVPRLPWFGVSCAVGGGDLADLAVTGVGDVDVPGGVDCQACGGVQDDGGRGSAVAGAAERVEAGSGVGSRDARQASGVTSLL